MTEHQKGQFIVVEGMDFVGKSSIAQAIVKQLNQQGITAVYYRNPGQQPANTSTVGEGLRQLVKSSTPRHQTVDCAMLFANRIHLAHEIRARLEQGTWVVVDRWDPSAHVYQSSNDVLLLKNRLYWSVLPQLNQFYDLPTPDYMVYAYADLNTVKARKAQRDALSLVTGETDRYGDPGEEGFDAWYQLHHNGYRDIILFNIFGHNYLKYYQDGTLLEVEGHGKDHHFFLCHPHPASNQLEAKYLYLIDTSGESQAEEAASAFVHAVNQPDKVIHTYDPIYKYSEEEQKHAAELAEQALEQVKQELQQGEQSEVQVDHREAPESEQTT